MMITSIQVMGYHPYYTGLLNQQCDKISQVWYILNYIWLFLCPVMVINYVIGHGNPFSGKPPGHFYLLYAGVDSTLLSIISGHSIS